MIQAEIVHRISQTTISDQSSASLLLAYHTHMQRSVISAAIAIHCQEQQQDEILIPPSDIIREYVDKAIEAGCDPLLALTNVAEMRIFLCQPKELWSSTTEAELRNVSMKTG